MGRVLMKLILASEIMATRGFTINNLYLSWYNDRNTNFFIIVDIDHCDWSTTDTTSIIHQF